MPMWPLIVVTPQASTTQLKSEPMELKVGSRDAGRRPLAATISRDVSSCPTWKQEPHRHLLLPMFKFCLKRVKGLRINSPPDRIDSPWMKVLEIYKVQELESTRQHDESI
ncbi:hypothetical protein PIB30_030785 [Stylosanthes scabra]|uniref:Uncharacterized protein n=1 Tax=Stylosanthes scabra TaxID=79078 RepID=A0ABU6Z9C1_9FABA|nr:hypothetical protein [Stylosanthes scabra]